MDDRIWEAGTAFAGLAVAALACFLLGAPVVVVGILALILDGVIWPLVTGAVVLATAGGLGWLAHRWFQTWRTRCEAPRRRNRVFISYRTAEHTPYVERVERSLQKAGVSVFLAKSGELTMDPSGLGFPWMYFHLLGMYQVAQLDSELQRRLASSDAVLYFVPTSERRLGVWRRMKDSLDAAFSLLLFQSGVTLTSWRFMWYAALYERNVLPAIRLLDVQSWQSWELGLAHTLGLPVVKLKVRVEDEPDESDEDSLWIRPESLEEDFEAKALPRLREAVREELKLRGPFPVMALAAVGFWTLIGTAMLSAAGVVMFLLVRTML